MLLKEIKEKIMADTGVAERRARVYADMFIKAYGGDKYAIRRIKAKFNRYGELIVHYTISTTTYKIKIPSIMPYQKEVERRYTLHPEKGTTKTSDTGQQQNTEQAPVDKEDSSAAMTQDYSVMIPKYSVKRRERVENDAAEKPWFLKRSDVGKEHKRWAHSGYKVGMYNFTGVLERVFEDMNDAVKNNGVGANYHGIVSCVKGRTKKHAGKVWRKLDEQGNPDRPVSVHRPFADETMSMPYGSKRRICREKRGLLEERNDGAITDYDLQRSDNEKKRKKSFYSGYRVGMFNSAGELERVFKDVAHAARNNNVGADFAGIISSVKSKTKMHAGKVWRKLDDEATTDSDLQRSDNGKKLKKSFYSGYRVGMFNSAGVLEGVFKDVADAVKNNDVGANFAGIVNCVMGNTKEHAGKRWRKM